VVLSITCRRSGYNVPSIGRAGRSTFGGAPSAMSRPPKHSFVKRSKSQPRCPQTITLDDYAAPHRAVREQKADGSLPADAKLRSSRYLNNLIEQDHRGVKQRIAVMLGFKEFRNAAITIAGIELLHRIRKGQFGLGGLGVKAELHLRSGTRCLRREVRAAQKGAFAPAG